jgi:sialate O-acetylesterase
LIEEDAMEKENSMHDKKLWMPKIFSAGMILQRGKPIRIWGRAPGGSTIHAELQGHSASTTAERGAWRITFPAMESAEHGRLSVTSGDEDVTIENVSIGEVWIAGGQSNMEFLFKYDIERDSLVNEAPDPLFRFFDTPHVSYPGQELEEDLGNYGFWRPCAPEHRDHFSAAAYYFGKLLREKLQVPVGIVGCNWGGTPVQTWIDGNLLRLDTDLGHYSAEYDQETAALDREAYERDFRHTQGLMRQKKFIDLMDAFLYGKTSLPRILLRLLSLSGEERKLLLSKKQTGPFDPNRPGGLFETMVRTIAGYGAEGVIWYQGETNADFPPGDYASLFALAVKSWREAWGLPLSFATVQLAPFEGAFAGLLNGKNYPELREQQRRAAETIPGVSVVNIMDAGERGNIHPRKKRPVGERLALTALAETYHLDLPYKSPRLESLEKVDGGMRIHFTDCYEGLSLRGDRIRGLQLFYRGKETKRFRAALEKESLMVYTKAPVDEIRFAALPFAEVNIFNRAGMPAWPFREKIV